MKHLLVSLLLLTTVPVGRVFAQNDSQRIESAKIAYITNRLNLTTEQAPQFWAIYNDYNGRKKDLNRRVRQLMGENSKQGVVKQNDADLLTQLKDINTSKQKIADLDDEYMPRFLKVISPAQLQELYKAERDFNRRLLEKLNTNQD